MTVYDAAPASTHNPSTGGVPTVAWGDLINANFVAIGEAWTAYTPLWQSSGTAPAMGNGIIAGAYLRLGKTLFVRIFWQAGTTSTYGTGVYYWTLPSGMAGVGQNQLCAARGFDASTGFNYVLCATLVSSAGRFELGSNGAGSVGQTSPITWTTSDSVIIEGVVELS